MKKNLIVFSSILFSVTIFWIGCKKNHPPDLPIISIEPESRYANVNYDFSVIAFDPDGDSISYQFDWGNEDTSEWSDFVASGTSVNMFKSWFNGGTYSIRARAMDVKHSLSKWSTRFDLKIIANNPPNSPSTPTGPSPVLIGDTNNFSSSVVDLEGDSVAIRFDWDDGDISEWSSFVPNRENVSIFHSFFSEGIYKVKAIAKDKYGAISTKSESFNVTVGRLEWISATKTPAWLPRITYASIEFDNRMWLLGGFDGRHILNDVWYSSDGINWVCATDSAPWSPKSYHTSFIFNYKMWVMGGYGCGLAMNDIWCSSDGVNWTHVTDSAAFGQRGNPGLVIFDNKIWILGGRIGGNYLNDIWCSSDGLNWTCVKESAEWSPRYGQSVVVYDNKMFLMGGVHLDDVWCSTDGVNWVCATDSAGWAEWLYGGEKAVVFDNKIWVIGNFNNYVCYSKDGSTWIHPQISSGWFSDMHGFGLIIFNNKIWVLGGKFESGYTNNIWYLNYSTPN